MQVLELDWRWSGDYLDEGSALTYKQVSLSAFGLNEGAGNSVLLEFVAEALDRFTDCVK